MKSHSKGAKEGITYDISNYPPYAISAVQNMNADSILSAGELSHAISYAPYVKRKSVACDINKDLVEFWKVISKLIDSCTYSEFLSLAFGGVWKFYKDGDNPFDWSENIKMCPALDSVSFPSSQEMRKLIREKIGSGNIHKLHLKKESLSIFPSHDVCRTGLGGPLKYLPWLFNEKEYDKVKDSLDRLTIVNMSIEKILEKRIKKKGLVLLNNTVDYIQHLNVLFNQVHKRLKDESIVLFVTKKDIKNPPPMVYISDKGDVSPGVHPGAIAGWRLAPPRGYKSISYLDFLKEMGFKPTNRFKIVFDVSIENGELKPELVDFSESHDPADKNLWKFGITGALAINQHGIRLQSSPVFEIEKI